jgi:hypothetical protein
MQRPSPTPRQPGTQTPTTGGRRAIWGIAGFVLGCILTALVMHALFVPNIPASDKPSANATLLKVTFTDALLTQELATQTASIGGVSQMRGHIQANGDIVVTGMALIPGLGANADVTMDIVPTVSNHVLSITIAQATVAGVPIAVSTFDPLRDKVNQRLAQSSQLSLGDGQKAAVSGVTFADGEMTLDYASAGA